MPLGIQMQIKGSTFLITGGASGLGAATARHLAGLGANVMVADLNEQAGVALAQEVKTVRFVRADVTSEADGAAVVKATVAAFGRIDGLVGCAGVAPGEKVVGKEGPH